jgi:hypothetical protein
MTNKTIEQKIDEILELLKPKAVPQPVEEWEDVTERVVESTCNGNWMYGHQDAIRMDETAGYRLRKIDGLHNGPAFVVERRKS